MSTTGSAVEPGDPAARLMTELPDSVRQRIVEWAAQALGGADPAAVPSSLVRVARFAPAKRAKLAAAALGQAVQNDPAFRALVAERAAATDPVGAAARAYLLRLPDEAELLAAVQEASREGSSRARVVELEQEVRSLSGRLDRATAELRARPAADGERSDEAERLRLRLREQGVRIRELQQQLQSETAEAAATVAEAAAERDSARAEAAVWQQRAEAATARAETAAKEIERLRRSAGERRAASDRRLELLLGALEGAASGLRREWDLIGGGPAPADVVAAGLPRMSADAERTADPARLTAWAGLPGAHLIVDGYNVTKTGFPELSLSEQRDRLARSLSALAARTSAEVTVVFDGAAVSTARPPARGVRVLFSPPGVLADTVIGDLVRAEPSGRVVTVVTSDREVADRAATDGARTAGSPVLLAAFAGGSAGG
ncbi:NYN domain-containing protein [Nakamurella sp. GG22]